MRRPDLYAAQLRGLTDADLAAELRHVASGMAREARHTRERAYWDECYRYLWGEWKGRGLTLALFTQERGRGWIVGERLGQLCESPIPPEGAAPAGSGRPGEVR